MNHHIKYQTFDFQIDPERAFTIDSSVGGGNVVTTNNFLRTTGSNSQRQEQGTNFTIDIDDYILDEKQKKNIFYFFLYSLIIPFLELLSLASLSGLILLFIDYENSIQRSLGGVEYALNVNQGQEVITISFQNISSTFKSNLITMQDALKGEATKFLYFDGTNYHWVRLQKTMVMNEIADGRFSTQIVLRQQIQ